MNIKKIVSILVIAGIAIGFSGCSQKFTHVDQKKYINSLDFSKYQKDGFLITPGEFGENYTSLGIFTFKVESEMNYKKVEDTRHSIAEWVPIVPTSQDILDLAYKTAKEKGADAITHFKMDSGLTTSHDGMTQFYVPYIEISGLLIKRNK